MADFDPHVPVPAELLAILQPMAKCRNSDCLVFQRHPHYLDESGPSAPCGPVVPTRVATEGVMLLGAYPNTRYRTLDGNEFVPAIDIDEPFENTRYFDGEGVRSHLSGSLLDAAYLEPLGLQRDGIYISNLAKCFLFREKDALSYRDLGFPGSESLESTRQDYVKVALTCRPLWLDHELAVVRPKLVIALGGEVRQIVHARDGQPSEEDGIVDIGGILLPAGRHGHETDTRDPAGPFFDLNIVHLYHPGALLRDDKGYKTRRHWKQHIPMVRRILTDLGLGGATTSLQVEGQAERLAEFRAHYANDPL